MQCYSCGTDIQIKEKIRRPDTCPKCSAYLHCCRNCRFHDVNAHHQCREPQAEFVPDKEMGNFCDYFEPVTGPRPAVNDRAAEARKKLEQLFKK